MNEEDREAVSLGESPELPRSGSLEQPEPGGAEGTETNLSFDHLEATNANIVGKQEILAIQANFAESEDAFLQQEGIYGALFGPSGRLDLSYFQQFSVDEIQKGWSKLVCDEKEVALIAKRLEQRRLLFLLGPPGITKTQIATAIVGCLAKKNPAIRRAWRNKRDVDHRLRIDWIGLLESQEDLRESVVILDGALHSGNLDLERLVSAGDELQIEKIRGLLWNRNSFLLVTGDEDESPRFSSELRENRQVLKAPEWSFLAEYLQTQAREKLKVENDGGGADGLLQQLGDRLGRHRETFEKELNSVSKIDWFIERSLVEYLEAPDTTDALDKAFIRLFSLHGVVRECAERGVDDLATLLAVAFCFPRSRTSTAEWLVFERIRHEIAKALDDELRRSDPKSATELFGESEVLKRLGVEVSIEPEAARLELADVHQSTRLWQALFDEGRRVLAICEPLLARLAVARGRESLATRQTVALAWIKLVALGSQSIFGRRFSGWLAESPRATGELETASWVVGWLLATQQQVLQAICIDGLDRQLGSGRSRSIERAVLCLGVVGQADLSLGLGRLHLSLERKVLPKLEIIPAVTAGVRGLASQQTAGQSAESRSESQRGFESALPVVLGKLFGHDESYRVIHAAQFVLVGWILRHGAISVFEKLARWMPDGEETDTVDTALLSLLFLRYDVRNALAVLDGIPWSWGGGDPSWNPILGDALRCERGPAVVARFLFKLLLGTNRFPPLIRRNLRQSLWDQLESWLAVEADDTDRRSLQVGIWRRLARVPDRDLRNEIADFLRNLQLRKGSGGWLGELESEMP